METQEKQDPTQKKPTLQIDLEVNILVGCIDVLEGFGQSIHQKSFSDLVAEVLSAIILGYQKDGQIPMYENEAEVGTRFLAILNDLGNLPEGDRKYIEEADVDTALSEIKQIEVKETQSQFDSMKQPLQAPVLSEESKTEAGKEKTIDFNSIPDTDSLKKKASSDLEKLALSFIYNNIPPDLWGSDKAEELWRRAIVNFGETIAKESKEPKEHDSSQE